MIIDKETAKAWGKYTRAVIEINKCMKEQGFFHSKMSIKEIDISFEFQDRVVREYFSLGEKKK